MFDIAKFKRETVEAAAPLEMTVRDPLGRQTDWTISFGPRWRAWPLFRQWAKEEITNAAVISPEVLFERQAHYLATRMTGWTPVLFNGEEFPFSFENAVAILLDETLSYQLVNQISDWLSRADEKFRREQAGSLTEPASLDYGV